MNDQKQTPKEKREQLRQSERSKNPTGNLNDAFNRANVGNLSDLVGSLSWGVFVAIIIAVIVVSFVLFLFV